ncbi:Mediator of RNA polymerase II transcription subunit [Phytophthora megakarya]|uniref:Mediator of RNA polymerase II transcription subunit 7 n=1 Tax=Phytophthora megakarya TaxID=4795 RepID=A0A225WFP8_9STRA|nr:Mediator of RNA polymerase II transcription subunit [Phytophthora megakarya]
MEPIYHMFGSPYSTQDVVPDLLPHAEKKLYAKNDETVHYKAEMKKINRSLLANFVELVDVLVKKPAMFNAKLDDVELLFLNMHNLINAFRPHQARETVIQMLKTQVQERRDAARDIRRTIDESRQSVERVHGELHDSTDDAAAADGSSPAGTEEDIKKESVDGSDIAGNGSDQVNASAVSSAALTPAQQEQTEVRAEVGVYVVWSLTNASICCHVYRKLVKLNECRNNFSRR